MDQKRGQKIFDAVRNAMTGYTAIVLAMICFIILLMLVIAIVRFVVGVSESSPATTATRPADIAAVQQR